MAEIGDGRSSGQTRFRIGEQIRARRAQYGWSLRDLATRIHRQPSRISEIETGQANSSLDSLAVIAAAMRMRVVLVPEDRLEEALRMSQPEREARTTTSPKTAFDEFFVPSLSGEDDDADS